MSVADTKPTLVVGGGITGITTALELSELGHQVILVEKEPFLGGRVSAFTNYFPKLCPPMCGLEINFKRLRQNPLITLHTLARVTQLEGAPGSYKATVEIAPRYVNDRCTACGECAKVCTSEREDTFNLGMCKTKAAYQSHPMAYPRMYVIDKTAASADDLVKIKDACKFGAVDLEDAARTLELEVGSVVWATGWRNYDVEKVSYLGYKKLPDVLTNLEFERLAAATGPTAGKLLRPSDGKEIESIAFVQCAGSRDVNHLSYCSGVCCLASLKQIGYVRERAPKAKIFMFHIDVRAGKYEAFYERMKGEENVQIIKGKVAGIFPEGKQLRLQVEDIEAAKALKMDVDLAVLATGVVPNTDDLPLNVPKDEHGFLLLDLAGGGLVPAGMVRKPTDVATCVQDATGAAMRALMQD